MCLLIFTEFDIIIASWGTFYTYGLILITAWISDYMRSKCGMKLLVHSQTSAVQPSVHRWCMGMESSFLPHYMMDVITFPCWDMSWTMLVKGALINSEHLITAIFRDCTVYERCFYQMSIQLLCFFSFNPQTVTCQLAHFCIREELNIYWNRLNFYHFYCKQAKWPNRVFSHEISRMHGKLQFPYETAISMHFFHQSLHNMLYYT